MNPTLDDLIDLAKDPTYNRLPIALAETSTTDDTPWWKLQEEITRADSKIQIWEAAQYIAVLFDTYPDLIKEVQFKVKPDPDSNEIVNYVYINQEECYGDELYGLNSETLEAMDKIDDMKAIEKGLGHLYDFPAQRLGRFYELVSTAFERPIHSSQEARAVALTHAPDIEAIMAARALDRKLSTSNPASQPRPRV